MQKIPSRIHIQRLDDARIERARFLSGLSQTVSQRLQLFHSADVQVRKNDITNGLDSGADDFLTKPVNAPELRVRITAGARILSMRSELQPQNALIQDKLDELKGLYAAITSDLIEAQKLQQSLIREHERQIGPSHISQFFKSSGHVVGDLVGFFEAGPSRLGVFGGNVSGHGISSALFIARVAGYFSSGSVEQSLALETCADGIPCPRAPEDVMSDLNH